MKRIVRHEQMEEIRGWACFSWEVPFSGNKSAQVVFPWGQQTSSGEETTFLAEEAMLALAQFSKTDQKFATTEQIFSCLCVSNHSSRTKKSRLYRAGFFVTSLRQITGCN